MKLFMLASLVSTSYQVEKKLVRTVAVGTMTLGSTLKDVFVPSTLSHDFVFNHSSFVDHFVLQQEVK